MTEQHPSFGYWVRRRRKALDLTQAALAERTGCVLTTIKKIETGTRQPSRRLAERLAAALALSSDERALMLHAVAARSSAPLSALPIASASKLAAAAALPATLPVPAGPLIGRARDVAALRSLMLDSTIHLITLTGTGGVGKTRLALHLAADVQAAFPDGVWFVDLSSLSDAALVPAAIARALGVEAGQDALQVVARTLRDRRTLLLIDNFEQVLAAAQAIAHLLNVAPRLTIVVTSRAPLRLRYEHEYAVLPLELPPQQPTHALDTYAAVDLFMRRAQAIQPAFSLTPENGATVAMICRRLDGLPLAIELAATRLRVLTPAALLRRLDQRLALLSDGARDLPPRQQALRATLDWSYHLLSARARRVFARLGVFAGQATLDAVETICGAPERGDILPDLTTLAEHSLIRQITDVAGEPSIVLLETIREYALEQLAARGEEAATRTQHAQYFLAFAEASVPYIRGPEQVRWLDWLEADHDNLRTAFEWLLEAGQSTAALRLAAALHWFWDRRGYLAEGRERIQTALDAAAHVSSSDAALVRARAWALVGATTLAFDQGDHAAVIGQAEQSTMLFRQLDDRRGLAQALLRLAFVLSATDPQRAHGLITEAQQHANASGDAWFIGLALFVAAQAALFGAGDAAVARVAITKALAVLQHSGDPYLIAHSLGVLGLVELADGQLTAARAALEQSLTIARTLQDARSNAIIAATTADIARCQRDYDQAAELYSESMALYHELGNAAELPAILHNQAYVALGSHDHGLAHDLFTESLRRQQALDNVSGVVEGINGMAALATVQRQLERAARLFGAAAAIHEAHPAPIWPAERFEIDHYTTVLRAQLSAAQYTHCWNEGHHYSPEQAIAYALTEDEQPTQSRSSRSRGLTARECEVAALIAHGATNRAIAETLVISERTVERHVANIFAKLDFSSRTQIAVFAVETGLAPRS